MQPIVQHKHQFSLGDYYRMADAGIFASDALLELIDGEIIDMAPIGSKHASVVSFLGRQLTLQLAEQAIVRIQDPVHLGDLSAPQPDLAIVKPRDDFYLHRHPQAEDILLLIEVADSSLQYDLKTKLPLYARFGIAECWLIDLNANQLNKFSEPVAGQYSLKNRYRPDAIVSSLQLPQIQLQLATLLTATHHT